MTSNHTNMTSSLQNTDNTITGEAHESKSIIKNVPLSEEEIPEALKKRYAIRDHLYFSKDRAKGLVFEDKGKLIKSKSSDPDDIRSMLDLAYEKNWSTIKVSGSQDFKREVWLAAGIKGIAVVGYKPNNQDIAIFEALIEKNKIEVVTQTESHALPTAAEVAIVNAAKEKGAGIQTQTMLKNKLSVAVSQLKAMGVRIPKPMIYDSKAASVREKSASIEFDRPVIQKDLSQPQITPKR